MALSFPPSTSERTFCSVQSELSSLEVRIFSVWRWPSCAVDGTIVRCEHGVGQQPAVGTILASLLVFTFTPECPELGSAPENRLISVCGRMHRILASHQLQSGQLGP